MNPLTCETNMPHFLPKEFIFPSTWISSGNDYFRNWLSTAGLRNSNKQFPRTYAKCISGLRFDLLPCTACLIWHYGLSRGPGGNGNKHVLPPSCLITLVCPLVLGTVLPTAVGAVSRQALALALFKIL